jgi:hypothetical protein
MRAALAAAVVAAAVRTGRGNAGGLLQGADYAEVAFAGLTRAVGVSGPDVNAIAPFEAAFCSRTSRFLGVWEPARFNATLVTAMTPEYLCGAADLSGTVALWPLLLFDKAFSDDRTGVAARFPCVDFERFYAERDAWMLDFFLAHNATGVVHVQSTPTALGPAALGMLDQDDMGVPLRYAGAPIYVLNCVFPASWRPAVERGLPLAVNFVLEEAPMARMFAADWYQLVFRFVFGALYTALGLRCGWLLVLELGRARAHKVVRSGKASQDIERTFRAETAIIMLLSSFSLTYLGVVAFFVEAWYSQGAIASVYRDSFSMALTGSMAACIVLAAGMWQDLLFRLNMSSVKMLGLGRSARMAVVGLFIGVDVCAAVLFTTKTLTVVNIIEPVITFFVLVDIVCGAYFAISAHMLQKAMFRTVSDFADAGAAGPATGPTGPATGATTGATGFLRRRMIKLIKRVHHLIIALAYYVATTVCIAVPEAMTADWWALAWGNFFFARWLVSVLLIELWQGAERERRRKHMQLTAANSSEASKTTAPSGAHDMHAGSNRGPATTRCYEKFSDRTN